MDGPGMGRDNVTAFEGRLDGLASALLLFSYSPFHTHVAGDPKNIQVTGLSTGRSYSLLPKMQNLSGYDL